MDKIKTIVAKEWAEVFRNRLVLFTVAFLPLILTAIPLITLGFTDGMADEAAGGTPPPDEFLGTLCSDLSEPECLQVYTLNIFTLMFMILPVAIPVTIAAYSIVGEKTTRSLEPLLATPITTIELVTAKTIAAAVPAVLATWLSFGTYLVGTWLMVPARIFRHVTDPMWLIAIFVVGPLLTIMAVSVAIIISSRVSDPRVAEQISALVVLPLIMLIVGQSVGLVLLDRVLIMIIGVAIAALDAVLVYLSVKIFQRETILTRWK
jgi:ABC-2 type transport system permease protein